MMSTPSIHRLAIRVYYEDTDFSGVVYHASYLRFLERGRTELLRALGIDQSSAHAATGLGFVVRTMALEFQKPARMDDMLDVETWVTAVAGASLTLHQRVLRGATCLVGANIRVALVRAGQPVRLPTDLRAKFINLLDGAG